MTLPGDRRRSYPGVDVVEAAVMQQQLVEDGAAAVTLTKRFGVVWRR